MYLYFKQMIFPLGLSSSLRYYWKWFLSPRTIFAYYVLFFYIYCYFLTPNFLFLTFAKLDRKLILFQVVKDFHNFSFEKSFYQLMILLFYSKEDESREFSSFLNLQNNHLTQSQSIDFTKRKFVSVYLRII